MKYNVYLNDLALPNLSVTFSCPADWPTAAGRPLLAWVGVKKLNGDIIDIHWDRYCEAVVAQGQYELELDPLAPNSWWLFAGSWWLDTPWPGADDEDEEDTTACEEDEVQLLRAIAWLAGGCSSKVGHDSWWCLKLSTDGELPLKLADGMLGIGALMRLLDIEGRWFGRPDRRPPPWAVPEIHRQAAGLVGWPPSPCRTCIRVCFRHFARRFWNHT